MNEEFKVEFKGGGSRRDFKKEFREWLAGFINLEENREFFMMLNEIVKNIYDHNHGYGYAEFRKTDGDRIYFKLGNAPVPEGVTFMFVGPEKCQEGHVNFGVGITNHLIEEIARAMDIDLRQAPLAEYVYEGAYQLK